MACSVNDLDLIRVYCNTHIHILCKKAKQRGTPVRALNRRAERVEQILLHEKYKRKVALF